jgi:hypothetical protein
MLPHKQFLKPTECCDRGADLLAAHRSNVVEAGRTKGAKFKHQVNLSAMMHVIEFSSSFLEFNQNLKNKINMTSEQQCILADKYHHEPILKPKFEMYPHTQSFTHFLQTVVATVLIT